MITWSPTKKKGQKVGDGPSVENHLRRVFRKAVSAEVMCWAPGVGIQQMAIRLQNVF